jgi:hypothetical protein
VVWANKPSAKQNKRFLLLFLEKEDCCRLLVGVIIQHVSTTKLSLNIVAGTMYRAICTC